MSVPERRQRRPEDIAGAPDGQAAVSDKSIVTSVPRSGELRQEAVQPQVQQEQDVSSQPQPQEQPKPQQPLVQNPPQGQLPPQQEAQAQETPQSDAASVPGAAPEQGVTPEPSAALSVTNEQGGQQGDVKPKQEQSQSQQDANAPSVSSEQDDEAQRRQRFESSIGSLNLDGNVDHLAERRTYTSKEMAAAGYENVPLGGHSLYPMTFTGTKADNTPLSVTATPIRPDGKLLDRKDFDEYINALVDVCGGDWEKMKEFDGGPDGQHILIGHDMSEESLNGLAAAYQDYYHPSSPISSAPSQGESSGGASSAPSSTPATLTMRRFPMATHSAMENHGVDLSTWKPLTTNAEAEQFFADWNNKDLLRAAQDVSRWTDFNLKNSRMNTTQEYKNAVNFWMSADEELKRRGLDPNEGYVRDDRDYNYYKDFYSKYSDEDLMKIWGSRRELDNQVIGDILEERGLINEGAVPERGPSSSAASRPSASTPAPSAPKDEPKRGDEGKGDNTSKSEDDVQDNDKPKPEEEPQSDTPAVDWKARYRDNSVEDLDTQIDIAQGLVDDPDTPENTRVLMREKVRQLTELRDEKKGASGSESSASSSPSASDNAPRYSRRQQKRRDEAAEAMSDKSVYNGNVDLLNRPHVDSKKMQEAGYDVPDGSYSSVYSSQEGITQYDPKTKESTVREILYTPILPDGTVKTSEEVSDYLFGLGEKGDIVELDKPENGGWGIVIAADVTDGNIGGRLHEQQEAYYSTPEDYRQMAEEASAFLSEMNGNQNPVAYKPVSKKAMVDAGWNAVGQSEDEEFYAWPVEQTIVDDKGVEHRVVMTPITPDGDILSPQDFADYVSSLQDNPDILGADKADSSLILMYDCEAGAADDVYNNIGTWVMGQADPEEGQRPSYRGEYIDDTRNTLVQNVATLQQQIDDLSETIRNFLEHPESTTRGAMLLDEYNNGLKAEGLTAEDERRREKSNRTARIIANLGDVLQGFANLAGTWYGAKSQELSSVTGGVDARYKTEGDARAKRAEALRKSYKEGIDRIYKEFNTDLTSLRKMWMDAVNRLADFDKSSGLAAQSSSNIDKRQERNQRRKEAENRRRERFQMERDAQRQRDRKEMAEINQRNAMARQEAAVRGRIKVKQTPGARR